MTRIATTLISTIALLTMAGAAHAADDTFEATFNYNKNASVEANYESFEKTAKKACREEVRRIRSAEGRKPLSTTARYSRTCRAELMDKVIEKTNVEVFIAYHNARKTRLG